MSSKTVQLQQTAQYIEQLEAENAALKNENAELKRINAKLYDNVERFVTRKTINDFPIDVEPRPAGGFDLSTMRKIQKPVTRIQQP